MLIVVTTFCSVMQALFSGASCDPAAPAGMQRNALGRSRDASLCSAALRLCSLTLACSLAGVMEEQQLLAQRLQVT